MELQEERNEEEVLYHVTIPKEEAESLVEGRLKEVKRRARIKGFRPGKAPDGIIKRTYGSEILKRTIDAILKNATETVLKKMEGLDREVIFGPSLEELSFSTESLEAFMDSLEKEGCIKLKFAAELKPEIEEVKGYRDIEIRLEEPEVSDEEVEKAIEKVLERFSYVEDLPSPRPAQEGDVVTISGTVEEDGKTIQEIKDASFIVGRELFIRDVEGRIDTREFIGKSIGEIISIPFIKDGESSRTFLKAMVKDIKERKIPELNDEILKTLNVKDEEELKKKVRDSILNEKRRAEKGKAREAIKRKLLEENRVKIPKRFLESYLERMLLERMRLLVSMGIPQEKAREELEKRMDDMRKEAEEDLSFGLLIEKIAEMEGIEVKDEEIEEKIKERAGEGVNVEMVKRYLESNPERINEMKAIMLSEKVVDFILGMNPCQE